MERDELKQVVKRLSGSSQKVKRAQILLKADADGPTWTDARIAEAFGCRTQTIEKLRQRLVETGFRATTSGWELTISSSGKNEIAIEVDGVRGTQPERS